MKRLLRMFAIGVLILPTMCRALDVIAHDPMTLTDDEVRDAFLGEKLLSGNVKLTPVDNTSAQEEFLAKALQTDRQKYYARWARKVYREGLSVPPQKGTDAEVAAFVRATPGAIGYVSGKAPSGVRVLRSY